MFFDAKSYKLEFGFRVNSITISRGKDRNGMHAMGKFLWLLQYYRNLNE